jgi:hypothetical protein
MASGLKAWLCGVGRSSIVAGVAGLHLVRRLGGPALSAPRPLDQLLQVAARELGHQLDERAVQALPCCAARS